MEMYVQIQETTDKGGKPSITFVIHEGETEQGPILCQIDGLIVRHGYRPDERQRAISRNKISKALAPKLYEKGIPVHEAQMIHIGQILIMYEFTVNRYAKIQKKAANGTRP